MPRYRFANFVLSPRRRVLLRDGREQPLIPRYFDLLVFLIEHRHEAVHRRDIFDRVWTDVVVSDSALSQAIRTIRRTLADDPREPRFIRTISRHGYQFVFSELREEDDEAAWPGRDSPEEPLDTGATAVEDAADPFEPLLLRVTRAPRSAQEEEDQREAAEILHGLGTAEVLRRLGTRPGHTHARALLRDTRWDTAVAGPVPVFGHPAPLATAAALIALRLRRAARMAASRGVSAALGGGLAGLAGGAVGGSILAAVPNSEAPFAVAVVLAFVGAGCGGTGGAGVGAGLAVAEATARSWRRLAVIAGAAVGGGLVGMTAQVLAQWSLAALVGLRTTLGGGLEGLVIGAGAGFGYVAATSHVEGGMAAPRGGRRVRAVVLMAAACGLAALGLTLNGRPLVGGTIHEIARASIGAQVVLTPLGALIGDPAFGRVSQALIGTGEGALFGLGLAIGLTRRP